MFYTSLLLHCCCGCPYNLLLLPYITLHRLLNVRLTSPPGPHMDVGIFGTTYFFDVMTAINQDALALEVLQQTTVPSFGHMVDSTATTLWEDWLGDEYHVCAYLLLVHIIPRLIANVRACMRACMGVCMCACVRA